MSVLTYVTAPDCHLCEDSRPVAARLATATGCGLREVEWYGDEGQALVGRDGVPFPPALYLDDQLLGFGRLSERRLRRLLNAVPA